MVFDRRLTDNWSTLTPLIMRLFNSEVKSSIGVSPAQLLFGNQVNLNRGFFLPHSQLEVLTEMEIAGVQSNNRNHKRFKPDDKIKVSEYMDKMMTLQQRLLLVAQHVQKKRNLFHVINHARKDKNGQFLFTSFEPGTYVLVQYPDSDKRPNRGAPSKAHMPWKGPLKVIASHNDEVQGHRYSLLNLITQKVEVHHISRLKQFYFNPNLIDPVVIANTDVLEYTIDHVVRHNGEFKKMNDMEFLIRWSGYDETYDSWEPWSKIKDMSPTHEYLRSIGQQSKIPKVV